MANPGYDLEKKQGRAYPTRKDQVENLGRFGLDHRGLEIFGSPLQIGHRTEVGCPHENCGSRQAGANRQPAPLRMDPHSLRAGC
jgi:hypothetical protein